MCIATRKFLIETEETFLMIGYSLFGDAVEMWHCTLCKQHAFAIQIIMPGLMRNVVHEKARKEHLQSTDHFLKTIPEEALPPECQD